MAHREKTRFSGAMWRVPATFTPLLGREREVAAIGTFLTQRHLRLLTLTGAAGVGKTRLSLEVAKSLRSSFADGVCFVELAVLRDPGLVIPTLAKALGIREDEHEPVAAQLKRTLHDKHLFLLLDNFEHLLSAAPEVEDLLTACPTLKIIVTSRSALRVQAEYLFPVAPLALPDLSRLPEPEVLTHTAAAVALFVQRAQTIRPDFQLTAANARTVAEICVRLDGLPLAIELAAARVSVLSPLDLLARLSSRLQLLTRGAWTLPERQQTLRKAMGWSYDLLHGEEQRLFRCLAVFVGGCQLAAVEALWAALGEDHGAGQVLDGVASLIDKSLLQRTEHEGEEPRFVMLETIREFGLERLETSREEVSTRRAHAAYFLALAEQAEQQLSGMQQVLWLQRLEREQGNIRAALQWLTEQEETELALRLGAALSSSTSFWERRGYLGEGRTWLKKALAGNGPVSVGVRAKAFYGAGILASSQGDYNDAAAMLKESLKLFEDLQEKRGIAFSLSGLGYVADRRGDDATAYRLYQESLTLFTETGDPQGICETLLLLVSYSAYQGDYVKAHALCEESLATAREAGDTLKTAVSLLSLAYVNLYQSNHQAARLRAEQSLALFKELGHQVHFAYALISLGRIAVIQGDYAGARPFLLEALAIVREIDAKRLLAYALGVLGYVHYEQGDYAAARLLCEEDLTISREIDDKVKIAYALENLAGIVAAQKHPTWAAQLFGVAETLRQAINAPLPPVEWPLYERRLAVARSQIGEKLFTAIRAKGRTMTLEQVLAQEEVTLLSPPLAPEPSQTQPATAPTESAGYPAGLTAREVEVLRLVAQGLTTAQIAERLVVSPHTVHAHISSIHSKLGVTSRSAATRFAFEQKLV